MATAPALSMVLTLITVALLTGVWLTRRGSLAAGPPRVWLLTAPVLRDVSPLAATAMAATRAGTGGADTVSPPRIREAQKTRRQPRRDVPSRRDFLRFGLLAAVAGSVASFGGASLAFLWPSLRGGFGARLTIGDAAFVTAEIAKGGGQFAYPAGRMYLVEYDASSDGEDQYADITNGTGFMALYQKCVHLGCRVPWCASSRWFECPCHGSRYNRWGEYQFGPAPRGLDRFNVVEEGGQIVVDTSTIITGPPRGGGVLNQSPEGAHCT